MITLIIPSFNRPSQLDCLLNSLSRYWSYNDVQIKVLYKYDHPDYEEGYYKVFEKHWYVHPRLEYDFCRQIKDFVNKAGEVVGFFTDDCVCYRKPDIAPDEILTLLQSNDILSFSLRLGSNTKIQNYLTSSLAKYPFCKELSYNVNSWKWKLLPRFENFGYIFSWDGHFYRKEWIQECFNICNAWENPRALEHQINVSDEIRHTSPFNMTACKTSSVFVNTINAVQNQDIPSGTKYSYSPKELNDLFLAGEIISLNSFDGLHVISCHEEIPLIFERDNKKVVCGWEIVCDCEFEKQICDCYQLSFR